MAEHFARVEVVAPGQPMPEEPHVVGDVKVDRVQLNNVPAGNLVYTIIELSWAFALRPSEAPEYLFSFAGQAASTPAYPTFEAGCAQMVESAIAGFLAKWTEEGGLEAFRKASAG